MDVLAALRARFITSPPFGRESSRAAAQRRPRLALTALSCAMSTPPSERRRLERELAGLLLGFGDLRDQLEASPAGLVGHFRRRRLARQLAGLEDRMEELRARWAALPDGD